MRVLFVEHGGAFKKGFVSEPFQNIHIYSLMCKILGLKSAKNDENFHEVSHLLRDPKQLFRFDCQNHNFRRN